MINRNRCFFKIFIIVILIIFLHGCENSINLFDDPVADYAVNCVVDTRNMSNIVRIEKLHQTEYGELPLKTRTYISDEKGNTYELNKLETSGNQKRTLFDLPNGLVNRGEKYRLTVDNESMGKRWGDFYCPKSSDPYFTFEIIDTDEYPLLVQWFVYLHLKSERSGAFTQRLFIRYEKEKNGVTENKLKELPIEVKILKSHPKYDTTGALHISEYDANDLEWVFPKLRRCDLLENPGSEITVTYDGYRALFAGLKHLEDDVPPEKIKIKGMFAVIYWIDSKIYENYLVNNYKNSSIRLDQQLEISNIENKNNIGYGFVGSIATDTVFSKVWWYYVKRCNYVDAQD
jgi:hypothetical protein